MFCKRLFCFLLLPGLLFFLNLYFVFSAESKTIKKISVSSLSFQKNKFLPSQHTCDGENISPQITWDNIPSDAQSIALILTDLDSPGKPFVHWIIYNIPSTASEITENTPPLPFLQNGARQGTNDFFTVGYSGPCPPQGPAHRYIFRVFVLNTVIDLEGTVSEQQLLKAIKGRVLAKGKILVKYKRL